MRELERTRAALVTSGRTRIRVYVLWVILAGAALRLLFAASVGLGVDESYVVAAGRELRFGYFDHPPAVWWLSWAAAHLFGSAAPLVVRLPFILLFALTTWLLYRLGERLFSARAGLFAAITLNLSPLYGVVFGSFVLPDGPLDCALLGAALCLARALESVAPEGRETGAPERDDRRGIGVRSESREETTHESGTEERQRSHPALGWWLGAGGAAGLALFSKYNAILVVAGALLYLATSPRHRFWLRRRELWLSILLAFLIFLPTLIWNARHGWASFAYQGERAFGLSFHPLAPFVVFAGEALYLLPWIWLPLVLSGLGAFRRGPAAWQGWLCLCLALPAVLFFSVVALWAHGRVLFHWAAPGYLMLFPLLGAAVAARSAAGSPLERDDRRRIGLRSESRDKTALENGMGERKRCHPALVRAWLVGTACLILVATGLVATEIRFDQPLALERFFAPGKDPALQLSDWHSLKAELARRHLLDRPGTVVATVRWPDAARISYALGPHIPVLVLGAAAHQFGLLYPLARFQGDDALILAPDVGAARLASEFGRRFRRIETLPPLPLFAGGRELSMIPLYLGERLH